MSECVDKLTGLGVTKRDAAKFLRDLDKAARIVRENNAGVSAQDSLEQAAEMFGKNAEMQAIAKKRNTYLNRMSRINNVDRVKANFAVKDTDAGAKAILVGTQGGQKGSRNSAGMEIDKLRKHYLGGVISDIAKVEGGVDLVQKNLLGREVANALFAIGKPGAKLDGMDVRAVAIAKALNKWQEISRQYANKAGAWIGKLEGFIVTQSHDMVRIARDRDGWMLAMRARADLPRMMLETGAESVDELLDGIYQGLSTGVHLKSAPGDTQVPAGLGGMAKGLSHDRVIHFKSADDWFDYNEAFGSGSVYDAAFESLNRMGRATGLMRSLGPNHELTWSNIVADLTEHVRKNGGDVAKFQRETNAFSNLYMGELDGSLNIPGHDLFSTVAITARAINSMASLGASLLASVSDLGVMVVGAKFNNMNALGMVAQGLKNFTSLPRTPENLEMMADMGLAFETLANRMSSDRFGMDNDLRGNLGRMQQLFFTANGQNRWTDAMRSAIAVGLSSNLARKAGTAFDGLDLELQRTLGLYGIDDGMWNIFRSGALKDMDGQKILTPNAAEGISDDVYGAYLRSKGQPDKPKNIAAVRQETVEKFRMYFTDQNGYMLLTPSAATMGVLKGGTAANTATGQIVRTITQFKSFSVEFSQRVLGREAKQHGLAGVANMIFLTTVAGYAAMSLKDMAKGRVPRDPTDPGSWGAAMAHGGGMGIFGDILTSQVTSRSQDAGLALFGPTAGDLFGSQGLSGIASRAAEGRDPSAAAVRFVQSNTPFANLFYTKLGLDYLVFWNAQEAVNPGSLDRMERELQDRTGQQMWVSPQGQFPNAPEIRQ